jgi:hypothetical protein
MERIFYLLVFMIALLIFLTAGATLLAIMLVNQIIKMLEKRKSTNKHV